MANGKGSTGNGGAAIGIQTLVSLAIVLFMAFGGGWTLFQAQFAGLTRQIDELRTLDSFRLDEQKAQIIELQRIIRNDLQEVFIPRREFTEFQKRFEALTAEVNRLQAEQHAAIASAARHPIEKETVDVIDADFSKRIDQLQVQIQDINRQIAAALIVIDNSAKPPLTKSGAPP
jgi:hypothetical protein